MSVDIFVSLYQFKILAKRNQFVYTILYNAFLSRQLGYFTEANAIFLTKRIPGQILLSLSELTKIKF